MDTKDPKRELVRRVQAGDRGALEEIFCSHRPRVEALVESRLKRSGSITADADDVVQEACLRAAEAIQGFAWYGVEDHAPREARSGPAFNLDVEKDPGLSSRAETNPGELVDVLAASRAGSKDRLKLLVEEDRLLRPIYVAVDARKEEPEEVLEVTFENFLPDGIVLHGSLGRSVRVPN